MSRVEVRENRRRGKLMELCCGFFWGKVGPNILHNN